MTTVENISLWQQIERQSWAVGLEKYKNNVIAVEDIMSETKLLFLTGNKKSNVKQCHTYVTQYVIRFAFQRASRDAGIKILFSNRKKEKKANKNEGEVNPIYVKPDSEKERLRAEMGEANKTETLHYELNRAYQIADSLTRKAIAHLLNQDCETLSQAAKMAGLNESAFSKKLAAIGAKLDPNCPKALAARKRISKTRQKRASK